LGNTSVTSSRHNVKYRTNEWLPSNERHQPHIKHGDGNDMELVLGGAAFLGLFSLWVVVPSIIRRNNKED